MARSKMRHPANARAGFVLGRSRFAKISAVEGIKLSATMQARIREADRNGLTAEQRRDAIIRSHRKD